MEKKTINQSINLLPLNDKGDSVCTKPDLQIRLRMCKREISLNNIQYLKRILYAQEKHKSFRMDISPDGLKTV